LYKEQYMLQGGERAPEFTLLDDTGKDRSLTDFLNSGAVVLYFHPTIFTPACVGQARAMRDLSPGMQSAKLRVVGLSPQDPDVLKKFRSKLGLPYTLLSDPHKSVISMYGVDGPWGLGVRRATYLIEGGRRIYDVVRADFRVARHAEFVRKAIMLRAPRAQ